MIVTMGIPLAGCHLVPYGPGKRGISTFTVWREIKPRLAEFKGERGVVHQNASHIMIVMKTKVIRMRTNIASMKRRRNFVVMNAKRFSIFNKNRLHAIALGRFASCEHATC